MNLDYNADMAKNRTAPINAHAQALGRLGGRAGTAAQNRARKANAQNAGRPRRVCTKCNEPVLGGHADRALDETCGRHGWRWERAGRPHAVPVNRARLALDAIAAAMKKPGPDVLTTIADILRTTGRLTKKGGN